jgi:hypothetical protein
MKHCLSAEGFLIKVAILIAFLCAEGRELAAQATAAVPDNLISSVAVKRPNHGDAAAAENGERRFNLEPNERITVQLQLCAGSGPISLLAPNGGVLNGSNRSLKVETGTQNRNITFSFQPGTMGGAYTIEVTDGRRTETLDLRTGPEPPVGKPGPRLNFSNN